MAKHVRPGLGAQQEREVDVGEGRESFDGLEPKSGMEVSDACGTCVGHDSSKLLEEQIDPTLGVTESLAGLQPKEDR